MQTSAPTQNPLRKANSVIEPHAVEEEDSCAVQKLKAHSGMEWHAAAEEEGSCTVALAPQPSQHPVTNVSPNLSNLRRGSPPNQHLAEKKGSVEEDSCTVQQPNRNVRRGAPSQHLAQKSKKKGAVEEVILSPLVQRWARINGGGEREEVDSAVGSVEAVEAVAVEEALVHEIGGELANCEDHLLTEVCQRVTH